MATLVRSRSEQDTTSSHNPFLSSNVPSPFPVERLQPIQQQQQNDQVPPTASQLVVPDVHVEATAMDSQEEAPLFDLSPSIVYVERACITTLNNLLSVPTGWNAIVPDRRHSMPTSQGSKAEPEPQSSSALQTLVLNLRIRQADEEMIQVAQGESESELIKELSGRLRELSVHLDPADADLAQTLVSLLSHLHRLNKIHQNSSRQFLPTIPSSHLDHSPATGDVFSTLKRQLSDFQVERSLSQQPIASSSSTPVVAVESALLWTRIDEELEKVVSICHARTSRATDESALPPQYDVADYDSDDLPEYDGVGRPSFDDHKAKSMSAHVQQPQQPLSAASEKMKLDLEAVTMAIDRLYLVAPQLHNQRVELKSSKVAEMERAARNKVASTKGKEKARDPADLDQMLFLIGKASERTLKNQSVIIEGGMAARLERARQRDEAKRSAFVQQLAEHSDAGRFHGQDAVLTSTTRMRDPKALLSLPEFIKEGVPLELVRQDPRAMLTLPEFVSEPIPPELLSASPSQPLDSHSRIKSLKKTRSRSLSAPSPLAWLRSSRSSKDLKRLTGDQGKEKEQPSSKAFEVFYIAENHDNLQHILVSFTVTGHTPNRDLLAEVLPPPNDDPASGDRLVIRSGAHTSLPLILPGRVAPGKKEIKVQSNYYEIKLNTLPSTSTLTATNVYEALPLLDATQLTAKQPTSFLCASCSLPLVHSSKVGEYKDLPSEHWEELVDSWMCHSDQKLHATVMKAGTAGFWPQPRQALVGGSYILFDQSVVTKNVHPDQTAKRGDDWRLSRCLCGAVVGRSRAQSGNADSLVHRLLKYAIRPISPSSDPVKIPLSAFLVEDMKEFVQAHAVHRFVIQDEEDERPRILIWLFKPSMQLAYSAQTSYVIPKHGTITAAKVLYKLLGPSEEKNELSSILSRYPGFPQAEYIFYPMDICRQIASLLKESNNSYPEPLRTLTDLDVGWLRRA